MFDLNSLPISGGVIVAGALWAGVSAFALGPLLSDRELIRDGWLGACEAGLQSDLAHQRATAPSNTVPEFDCNSTFGLLYGDQGQALCQEYGNFSIPIPGLDSLREQERRAHEAETRRIDRAASKAGSRCECAASVYQAQNRLPLALYAGSGRLITPPQVKSREAELTRVLASPACAMKAEG